MIGRLDCQDLLGSPLDAMAEEERGTKSEVQVSSPGRCSNAGPGPARETQYRAVSNIGN